MVTVAASVVFLVVETVAVSVVFFVVVLVSVAASDVAVRL